MTADSGGLGEPELPARIVLELTPDAHGRRARERTLQSALKSSEYELEPLFKGAVLDDGFGLANYFLVTLPLTRGEAGRIGHDFAYSLLGVDGVRHASYERAYPRFAPLGSALCPGEAPSDKAWSHRAIRLPEGLKIRGEAGGTGIVIGHPDTGWVEHAELEPGLLDLERQWSTLTQKPDAIDPMQFPLFKGHGTGTASVLAGRPAGEITGVAPGATVIPIRCIESVALVLDVEVARAVWYASRQNVHVISMSVGGHPIAWLEGVIAHAIYVKNIIVCAAAGNGTPYVVFPGAYPDCIAVASMTPTDRPAAVSSFGPEVTIAAPGHKVWEADFLDGNQTVTAGCGTSYATPHVGGAAALWLHMHGRDNLLRQYEGRASLQEVFKLLLRRTARNPGVLPAPGETGDINRDLVYAWNTSQYGAGILNVEALLATSLPTAEEASTVNPHDWAHTTWNEIMYGRFHDLDPQQIEGRLNSFFAGVPAGLQPSLEQFGSELTELLMNAEGAYQAFQNQAGSGIAAAGRELDHAGREVANAAAQAASWAEHTLADAAESVSAAAAAVSAAFDQAGAAADQAVSDSVAAAEAAAAQAAATAAQIVEDARAAAEHAARAAADAAAAAAAVAEEVVEDVMDAVSDTLKFAAGLFS